MEPSTDFGFYLREARQRNDMSLSEAAALIKCTKAHLWELEKGSSRNPSIAVLAGIAAAYGLDIGEAALMAAGSAPGADHRKVAAELSKARRKFAAMVLR